MPSILKSAAFIASLCASQALFAENAVVGTGTPASCTETTFNAALALVVNDNQGGTLTFNCGPDPDIILLSSVKNLAGIVTIDGGGKMTLDGQDLTRLFNINPRANPKDPTIVALQNIDLNRGSSGAQPFGGAILANAGTRLNLDNVSIRNSLASTSGGAIATFANVNLDIANSRFQNNLAANGGAIATRAIVNITGSTFTNNNASGGQGGAIQSYEQNLTVTASTFSSNGASEGGAIFKSAAVLSITESSLDQNTSANNGGAIHVSSDVSRAVLESNYLRRNRANQLGGAVFALSEVFVFQSSFADNSAREGGALSVTGTLDIRKSTLANNSATAFGGAVSLVASANRTPFFSYVTTHNNTVTAGPGADFEIVANVFRSVDINNSTLMGASASSGGSSVHLTGPVAVQFRDTLIWPRTGTACFASPDGTLNTGGGNFGPSNCGLNAADDFNFTIFSAFSLGEFANYGGAHDSFLPLAASPVLERARSCANRDTRAKPSPVDGDGNGSSLCDSGAVERQLLETPGALFRNGFESTLSIQQ
jgi:predicted outer membrane repeat protein